MRCLFFLMTSFLLFRLEAVFEYDRAARAYNKSDFETAQKIYDAILVNEPQDYCALYNLGKIAYKQGRFETAKAYYAQALERGLPPQLKEQTFFDLGNTQVKLEQWQDALHSYEEVIALNEAHEHAKKMIEQIKKLLQEQEQQQNQQHDEHNQDKDEQQEQEQQKKDNHNQQNNDNDRDQLHDQHDDNEQSQDNPQEDTKKNEGQQKQSEKDSQSDNSSDQKDQKQQKQQEKEHHPNGKAGTDENTNKSPSEGEHHEQQSQKPDGGDQHKQQEKRAQHNAAQAQQQQQKKLGYQKEHETQAADAQKTDYEALLLKEVEDEDAALTKMLLQQKLKNEATRHGQKNW